MRAVAVIDGEHYAPVVRDALAVVSHDVVAAVLVGGTEKLRGGEDYGVPLVARPRRGDRRVLRRRSCSTCRTSRCSARRERMRLASRALALGVAYEGADFRFEPPSLEPFDLPSLGIVGTGKRVGKTAVTGPRRTRALPRPASRRRRDGARRASGSRGRAGRADGRCAARALARGAARGVRPPRDGRLRRRRDRRLSSLRGRPRRCGHGLERRRGSADCRRASARARSLRRQRGGAAARCHGTAHRRRGREPGALGRDRLPQRLPPPARRPRRVDDGRGRHRPRRGRRHDP